MEDFDELQLSRLHAFSLWPAGLLGKLGQSHQRALQQGDGFGRLRQHGLDAVHDAVCNVEDAGIVGFVRRGRFGFLGRRRRRLPAGMFGFSTDGDSNGSDFSAGGDSAGLDFSVDADGDSVGFSFSVAGNSAGLDFSLDGDSAGFSGVSGDFDLLLFDSAWTAAKSTPRSCIVLNINNVFSAAPIAHTKNQNKSVKSRAATVDRVTTPSKVLTEKR